MALIIGSRKKLVASILKGFSINWGGGVTVAQQMTSRAYSQKVGDGTECDVIMIPVLWAARRMAESPVGVKKIDDNEIDMKHPLARLLRRPSPWYSGSAFRKAQTIEWLVDGNTYAYKIRGKRGEVLAEQFIPHWAIAPHMPDNGFIDYYEYYPMGVTSRTSGMVKLLPEDVIHLRNGIDPNNPTLGLSSLKILLRELYTDVEASEFTAMLLKNAGVMGVVISPKDAGGSMMLPGEKPEDAKKRYKETWAGTRRGEPFVAAGPLDVNYVGVDAAKLDLARLREIPEERVTGLLGIPAAVAGLGTGLQQTKVGATMSEMRAMAYEDCIIPMQNEWCCDWDMQLLPDFEANPDNFQTAFDLSKVRVLQDDENKKSDRLTRQFSAGGITRRMYLEGLGYESTDNDDVYYLSIATQIVPLGQANGDAPPQPNPAAPAPKGQPIPKTKAVRAPAAISRLMHRLEREKDAYSKKWTALLDKKFRAYGDHVASVFGRVAKEWGLKAEPDYQQLGESVADQIDELVLDYAPHYLAIGKGTFDSINTVLHLGVNLSDPVEFRIIAEGGKRMGLIDIPQQTRDAIFSAIKQGREAGEGAAGLVSLIREAVAGGPWAVSETRAMMIARTEAKYAQNYASLEAYKSSDTITGVEVFDAQLGPTDEECEQRNGRVVTFEIGQQMVESEHPNGTISLSPYMGELPDDADVLVSAAPVPQLKASNGDGHSPVSIIVNADGKIQRTPTKRSITIRRDGKGRLLGATVIEEADGA